MKSLSVGIDLDGVIYNFWESLFADMRNLTGATEHKLEVPKVWNAWEEWGIPKEIFDATIFKAMHSGVLFREGEPMPGAIKGLIDLVVAGHSVTIVTAREVIHEGIDYALMVRLYTYAWLTRYAIPHSNLIFSKDKTGLFDIFLDDSPEVIEAFKASGERCVIFDAPYNQACEGERVKSWKEFDELCVLAHVQKNVKASA